MADRDTVRRRVLLRSVRGYGLIGIPADELLERVIPGVSRGWDWRVADFGRSLDDGLDHLKTVTHPATRFVVVELAHGWSAVVDNGRNGSDPVEFLRCVQSAPERLRTIRVVEQDASFAVSNGYRQRLTYECRIVEVHDGTTARRSIACADDGGRWVFETSGEPFPIESSFDYGARSKRHRFTSANLGALLHSLGAPRLDGDVVGTATKAGLIVAQPLDRGEAERIQARSCTAAEADDPGYGYYQRALTWMEHLATHAPSAVVDLTKALLFNPALEPLVRPALAQARIRLGSVAYLNAVRDAERSLESSRVR